MKKIFSILFLTILIAKAFPYESDEWERYERYEVDEWEYIGSILPEIVTLEWGTEKIKDEGSSPYWKLNLLNIHFVFENTPTPTGLLDFEITPTIISKNRDTPFNFSFINLRIRYIFGMMIYNISPFLGINYLNLKEGIFDYNTLNLQAGVRIGFLQSYGRDLFDIETGYAYKNNRHSYYFSIGISPFFFFPETQYCLPIAIKNKR